MKENVYLPTLARIVDVKLESGGLRPIKTFRLELVDEKKKKEFSFRAGQCMMVGLLGVGESMFAISSNPMMHDFFEVSVMRHGKVTSALHEAEVGDVLSVRGPFGNFFDVESWKGKDLLFVGGGIGQAPLRSVIGFVLDKKNRADFGSVDVLYGASDEGALCFLDELNNISCRDDVNVHLSVDCSSESECQYFVGFVPDNLARLKPNPKNCVAVTCGPPIMIKLTVELLESFGFSKDQIFTTLEQRMKCGVGKCGRCNIGGVYVCRDGPVFSAKEIEGMQGDF